MPAISGLFMIVPEKQSTCVVLGLKTVNTIPAAKAVAKTEETTVEVFPTIVPPLAVPVT